MGVLLGYGGLLGTRSFSVLEDFPWGLRSKGRWWDLLLGRVPELGPISMWALGGLRCSSPEDRWPQAVPAPRVQPRPSM